MDRTYPRIMTVLHCLGSIDELNASIGFARVTLSENHAADLESIQNDLFNIGGEISIPAVEKPLLHRERIDFLEKRIKSINKQLLPLERSLSFLVVVKLVQDCM